MILERNMAAHTVSVRAAMYSSCQQFNLYGSLE